MTTRKLEEPDNWGSSPPQCRDPQHDPASMRVYEPGLYEHVCPSCKRTMVFRVEKRGLQRFDIPLRKGS